jgi:putative heme-binding domain-containing protein
LTHIGSKYTKAVLLQHILEPSRAVEPNYQAYLLETKSGQVHSGLLVEKTNRDVVLKDAASKSIRIPASEVEQLVPQPKSIMPELMFRDLTAQQAADLLEFLARQK